ncbi:hypothetical protein [Methylobacterium sp. JK268]
MSTAKPNRPFIVPVHHPVDFGSSYGGLLRGVARGLLDVFPPVPHPPEAAPAGIHHSQLPLADLTEAVTAP